MEMGFTEIRKLVDEFIDWLKKFFQAVEDMFGGIKYEYAGYPTTTEAAAEENKPL